MGKEGQAEAGVEVSRAFYPHDSSQATMAAGDLVAPQLLQRDLLVKFEAAGGHDIEGPWNKATGEALQEVLGFLSLTMAGSVWEESREADMVSPLPLLPPGGGQGGRPGFYPPGGGQGGRLSFSHPRSSPPALGPEAGFRWAVSFPSCIAGTGHR